MADHLVLDCQLFLLELVESDVIWVRSMLFLVDERFKMGVLLFESLDLRMSEVDPGAGRGPTATERGRRAG